MSILFTTDDNDDLLLSQFASRYDQGAVNDRVCAILDPPSAAPSTADSATTVTKTPGFAAKQCSLSGCTFNVQLKKIDFIETFSFTGH